MSENDDASAMRLDKWLWAARFFKTRSIAQDALGLGRVLIDGQRAKPSRDVKPGMTLAIERGDEKFTVVVAALSNQRRGAKEAALLYEETPESLARRQMLKDRMKFAYEPARSIPKGRPTKKDARLLKAFREDFE